MALASPLMPSPSGVGSAFSPYTDSPNSPAPPRSPRFSSMSGFEEHHRRKPSADSMPSRASEATDSLHPPPSPHPPSSMSDVPDPSPISNGTEGTEIEDSADEDEGLAQEEPQPPNSSSGESIHSDLTVGHELSPNLRIETYSAKLKSIDTTILNSTRSDSDETPQSVIHAPPDFKDFNEDSRPPSTRWSTPSPTHKTDVPKVSPKASKLDSKSSIKNSANSPLSPPPLETSIDPPKRPFDNATPRAQTWQEVEALERTRRQRASTLEDIPENQDIDSMAGTDFTEDEGDLADKTLQNLDIADEETSALKTALSECWTLCNTLASLSSIHRQRIFNFAGKGEIQEQAWKCCWKLCQKLYESRDEDHGSQVRPTLDLCKDFCQALFEVRQRENELADSVLRVSFELNNHLYNTHDRNLPEAFRERTLDFYITLCHRLMKQRNGLAEETDSLLRACWSLAEMLFSLRQNKREGKQADEELLGSAVQACWELCDLFREGWTQVRPDRGTPRPSQTTFTQAFNQTRQPSQSYMTDSADEDDEGDQRGVPETPTTIFEDTTVSPDEAAVPNILVLGPDNSRRPNPRWSSTSSTLSGYSQSSQSTSSTATTTAALAEDVNLTRLKILIIKAAMNSGFQRNSPQPLSSFVKALSSNSFGNLPWQIALLGDYKKTVMNDPSFRAPGSLPTRRASAAEISRAVQWMVMRSGQYIWLRDLFRLVFGFHTEEAEMRKNVTIQT
ncbi:MAG: hypothetical protein M1827_001202 [Pycnora praestabilis]|nr:MAG: hypothetical protein M1827_001202 [Pycnora praestabilis]